MAGGSNGKPHADLAATAVTVRLLEPAELAASRIWIDNWQRMLPCLIATRDLVPTSLLSTTAVDTPEARHRVAGSDIAGRGIDVDAARLTTTSHAQWSGAFAISVDTVTGESPER